MLAPPNPPAPPAIGVEHYENFPVASWLCPPHLRAPIQAFYGFARTADDLADEGDAPAPERLAALASYRAALRTAVGGTVARGGPWASVFTRLCPFLQSGLIPEAPLHALLDAFEQDIRMSASARSYLSRADLLDYCRRSANPVGRVVLHLCGLDDADSLRQSDAICSALQLINFWQDLSQDLPRGRYYLAQEDLARHAMPLHEPQAWPHAPGRQRLVAECCEWSRSLMQEGAPLVHRVPGRLGWELRLVVQGGLRVLDRLAAVGYDSFHHRPKLGAWDAWVMASRALAMRAGSATIRAR